MIGPSMEVDQWMESAGCISETKHVVLFFATDTVSFHISYFIWVGFWTVYMGLPPKTWVHMRFIIWYELGFRVTELKSSIWEIFAFGILRAETRLATIYPQDNDTVNCSMFLSLFPAILSSSWFDRVCGSIWLFNSIQFSPSDIYRFGVYTSFSDAPM